MNGGITSVMPLFYFHQKSNEININSIHKKNMI